MKIRRVGAELFHADGRTDRQRDMTKVIGVFRNFVKARNKAYSRQFMPTYRYIIRRYPCTERKEEGFIAEFRNQFIGTIFGRRYVSSCNYNPVDIKLFLWFVLMAFLLGAVDKFSFRLGPACVSHSY
jgi:hypothetical protein